MQQETPTPPSVLVPAAPLDLGIGRTVRAEFFDASATVRATTQPTVRLTAHPLKHYVDGAFSLPVFSAAFCRLVTQTFYRGTTLQQRRLQGVPLSPAFYTFGDVMARALDAYLPQLAHHASLWFRKASQHSTGGIPPKAWQTVAQRWCTPRGRFTADDKQLRFVEAVVIYYDRPAHPAIRMHTDEHDVTLNVCVGREFAGGQLVLSCQTLEQLRQSGRVYGCGCHRGRGHEHQQQPGIGVLNLNMVPHCTRKIVSGERINLVLKFVLAPHDRVALAPQRGLRHWPRLFTVLQRHVLGFLDARSLVYMAQTCTAMNTAEMCALPGIWHNLYARNPTLVDFVSVEELQMRSGQRLWCVPPKKLGTVSIRLNQQEEAHRRQVVLVANNWKEAYKQARIHSFVVEQLQAARRRSISRHGTGTYTSRIHRSREPS